MAAAIPALVDTRREYDRLLGIYLPTAGVVAALVIAAIGFCVLRYRRPAARAGGPARAPRLEIAYVLALGGVAAALLAFTFRAESRVDALAARPGLTVDVVAARWQWRFHYPAYGITRIAGTVGHQDLIVPARTTVRLRLRSIDVIHSFWVPERRYKEDVFPGTVLRADMMFPRPGLYRGECAEFCGLHHADMDFRVLALAPSAFRAWAARRATPARGAGA